MNNLLEQSVDRHAQIIWDYMQLSTPLEKAECMIVLGSNDPRVAETAAQLLKDDWADYAIYTGAVGRGTHGLYGASEAEYFARYALDAGVDSSRVFIEPKATNTGDNFRFSIQLLEEKSLSPKSFLLVQKNYMCRRAYATFRVHYPNEKVILACPDLTYLNYPYQHIDKTLFINTLVGDLQRMWLYAEKGYQIVQDIPQEVMDAYLRLVQMGFDKQLA